MECHPQYNLPDCDQRYYDKSKGRDPEKNPYKSDQWYQESLHNSFECGNTMEYREDELSRAQWTYLLTAIANSVHLGLDTFRYRASSDSYYINGEILGGTNYWQLANQVHGYSGLVFWSLATVTQLMSMLEIVADLNLLVWLYGGRIFLLTSTVTIILEFLAYDKSYQILSD